MSVSKDYSKPTVEDLGSTPELKGFPAFSSSMGGGNMVTEKNPHFAGQGTDSESTHDVVAGNVDWVGNVQHTPELPGPDAVTGHVSTDETGSGYSPSPRAWEEL